MTISSQTQRHNYTAAGGQTVFPFTFEILATTDLLVYVDGVLKNMGTDYSVSAAPWTAGGNVTFVTAPGAGVTVVILRYIPLTQVTDLIEGAKFSSETIEDVFDKLTMLCQDLKEVVGRALVLTPGSLYKDLSAPDPVAGGLLKWKSDISGLENYVAAFPGGNPGDNFDWGTGAPIAGTWAKPWIRFNSDHQLGDPFAWVLITDGTPGVWAEVGFVSANPV